MINIKQKNTTILAWVLCALCVVSTSAQAIIALARTAGPLSLYDSVEIFGWRLALPVLFSVLAALIIARQPGNRVGWLMMLPALTIASPDGAIIDNLSAPPAALTPGLWLLLWLNFWSWIPVIFPIILIPLHFPSGRPPSPRWGWLNWLAIGMWLFFAIFSAFAESLGPLNGGWTVPNPVGLISNDAFEGLIGIAWGIGLAVLASFSVASLIVRYRRARFGERQQIKWLLFAGAGFAIYYISSIWIESVQVQGTIGWSNLLFVGSILAMPIAIAIAILRYRLYDIDVIIRKILVYFGSIVLLQTLFQSIIGQESALVIILSTLLIAALFMPLRQRVQRFIDQRFFRAKYDTAQTLAAFARFGRDEVEMDRLTAELVRVVEETMRPTSISVWIKFDEQVADRRQEHSY